MHDSPTSETPFPTLLLLLFLSPLSMAATHKSAQSCRLSCGAITIAYPFGLDDGCGNPHYRHSLACTPQEKLLLRTPSGLYPVTSISYSDPPYLLLSPSFLSNCNHLQPPVAPPIIPFTLDTATPFRLSHLNTFLFFNCSPEKVIIQPRSLSCERFPEKCSSVCDSADYFCRNLPNCPSMATVKKSSCCSYFPRAAESVRVMLQYCTTYTSVHWRRNVDSPEYGEVPEYGSIRVDFEIPVSRSCLQCGEARRGGAGTCGFDTKNGSFLCLCRDGKNFTTPCNGEVVMEDDDGKRKKIFAAAATVGSMASCLGVAAGICYLRKTRRKESVVCGVQSNENRLF